MNLLYTIVIRKAINKYYRYIVCKNLFVSVLYLLIFHIFVVNILTNTLIVDLNKNIFPPYVQAKYPNMLISSLIYSLFTCSKIQNNPQRDINSRMDNIWNRISKQDKIKLAENPQHLQFSNFNKSNSTTNLFI
ncbi:hypothetical protein EDEG_01666 [Edhazardia aedis USNM 41457]|uniref:Uncharacterized protein n=1 Tax=Edhazardia aedis (strain USNM 41457) TaxID=1003232 RepID=J9DRT8_EDHAE|nr:hypothetical protein EDEG_01666 [Edhazardia aedis USNM 41457]|eukprot:EJW04032.1 hypothetical protein EDEG_01666 [Edhazardia aedis USNM 41457]